jgi:hypothetical protein
MTIKQCPTCGHYWTAKPALWKLWLWPVWWTRCPFLDYFPDWPRMPGDEERAYLWSKYGNDLSKLLW